MGISSMKSSNSHGQRGNNNNNMNKPYAVMMLLLFGAAILGVMVLQKLREKRIFTLLLNQKDHDLLTLHLLFQREKEFNQEARKKIEAMKNRVYSLRTQKLELDRRLVEMDSTISALKDERKVIVLTLEERRNEMQMLTAAMNSTAGDPAHLTAFKSMIKLKDREIEDLKLRLRKLDVRSETGDNDGESQLNSYFFGDSTKGESQNGENIGNKENGRYFRGEQDGNINEEKSKVVGRRREIQRNSRSGDDLYSVSKTESTAIDEQQKFEKIEDENKNRSEFQIKKYTDTRNDALSKEKEEAGKRGEETERKLAEIKSNGTKAEHMEEHGKSMNVETKLIDESNKQLNKQDENKEQEKEDEQGNEIANEESEGEDSEEAETREPEIDREDIKRFSESDPDDETEETEF